MSLSITERVTHPFPGLTRKILTSTAESMLVQHRMEAGSVFPLHSHRHEQTVFILEGELIVEMHEGDRIQTRTAHPGDSWVVPSQVPHRVTAVTPALVLDFFTPSREDYLEEVR